MHCYSPHADAGAGFWGANLVGEPLPSAGAEGYSRGSEVSDEGLSQCFLTAILLTANKRRAEAAVLESISLSECEFTSNSALLRGTIKASLAGSDGFDEQAAGELAEAGSTLPAELRHVLHLSQDFRQCFVLRILLGLSGDACASLLGLDVQHIDELTCASVFQLAASDTRLAN
jgi:hypothetical protein